MMKMIEFVKTVEEFVGDKVNELVQSNVTAQAILDPIINSSRGLKFANVNVGHKKVINVNVNNLLRADNNLLRLKAAIIGMQHVSKKMRARATLLKGEPREEADKKRKQFGKSARYHHLAYAYMKRVPYRCVEQSTRENNAPDKLELLHVLESFQDLWHYATHRSTSTKDIETWLNEVPPEQKSIFFPPSVTATTFNAVMNLIEQPSIARLLNVKSVVVDALQHVKNKI